MIDFLLAKTETSPHLTLCQCGSRLVAGVVLRELAKEGIKCGVQST
jgi:hypothetical protein